jgi:hypothetical protein
MYDGHCMEESVMTTTLPLVTSIKLYVGRWFDHKSGKGKDHEIAI